MENLSLHSAAKNLQDAVGRETLQYTRPCPKTPADLHTIFLIHLATPPSGSEQGASVRHGIPWN
ncbi:hypothetical protein QJS04_geneDACA019171 [Acorus gramineus]|uniref:Uncharacterized protein n=1 Tax=Acorus gramineus TaxID=55184 RepID=A0AAV9BEC1_ACOGR|nr:hypothetical protein QJS04_geneDACA019171 [Acorus gramineus]